MPEASDILIVGGYGVVGRRIAALLAPRFDGRVVIAGRNRYEAVELCRVLRHGTRARWIDLGLAASVEQALDGVGTVVMCVAEPAPNLLRMCIARGLAYTDTAPRLAFWQGASALHEQAHKTGARAVLGTGLSPGISNMMALHLADALGRVDRIETAILLSLGDEYGPDSLHHVLDAVTQPCSVRYDGEQREAVPFSDGRPVRFPQPLGLRTAYLFPWSDVVYYPETLGARTSIGRLALEPPWLGKFGSILVRTGARRWLKRPAVAGGHRRAIERVKRLYTEQDYFGLVVTAEGGGRVMQASLVGRHQADVTAAGAAEQVRALADGEVTQAGVWLPEQVMSERRFFAELAKQGWRPTWDQTPELAPMAAPERRAPASRAHVPTDANQRQTRAS